MCSALWSVTLLLGIQPIAAVDNLPPAPAMIQRAERAPLVPLLAKHRYWRFRTGYFQGPNDYRRVFDYPWDMSSPLPWSPAMMPGALRAIDAIPGPPMEPREPTGVKTGNRPPVRASS